jgi:hypothetical protein
MDRRAFLTRTGTLGAAAGGWASLDAAAEIARAEALAAAAGAATQPAAGKALPESLVLGFLSGSPGLLAKSATGDDPADYAGILRWFPWKSTMAGAVFPPGQISVSLGLLQRPRAPRTASLIRELEVTALFAIDEAPNVVPFRAWRFQAAGPMGRSSASPPLTFDATAPNRVALQVDYALEPRRVAAGNAAAGRLYLPLGGRNAPGVGLYVLAGPSSRTGRLPDLATCVFSGDLNAPLKLRTGGATDFDHVVMAVRAAIA